MVTQAKPPPEKVIEPGIYTDIPIEDYHAGPGVSKSQLDLVSKAPALLEWSRKAPRDDEARSAVDIGHALHALLLQPDTFDQFFAVEFAPPAGVIATADDARMALDDLGIGYTSKDTKQALVRKLLDANPDAPVLDSLREQWAAGAAGKMVLTHAEYRKVRLMRDSVMAHPFAKMLLEADGPVEASHYFIDPETGELCRFRPDKAAHLGNALINADVKSADDVDEFWRSVDDYRYDVQDGFYTHGTEVLTGERAPFVFIVVGSRRNAGRYPVRCIALPQWQRERGAATMRADLNRYAECKRTGNWPGIELLSRPAWARTAA